MKPLYLFLVSPLLILFLSSCGQDATSGLEETDLMRHGLPLKILAPPDLEVESASIGSQQEFKLNGGDDFTMEVHVSEGLSGNMSELVSDLKKSIESHRFFNGYFLDEPDGFIYEFKMSETISNFGFRRVRIQGDKEFVFRNGPGKIFTEEQATRMFKAVGG